MSIDIYVNVLFLVFIILAINSSVCIRHGKVIEVNKKELSKLLKKIKTSKVKSQDLSEHGYNTLSTIMIEENSLDTRKIHDNTINNARSTVTFQKESATTNGVQDKSLLSKNHVSSQSPTNSKNNLHTTKDLKTESDDMGVHHTQTSVFPIYTTLSPNIKDAVHIHNMSNSSSRINGVTPYPIKDNNDHKTKIRKRPIRRIKCPTRSDPRKINFQFHV